MGSTASAHRTLCMRFYRRIDFQVSLNHLDNHKGIALEGYTHRRPMLPPHQLHLVGWHQTQAFLAYFAFYRRIAEARNHAALH